MRLEQAARSRGFGRIATSCRETADLITGTLQVH